MRRWLNPLSVIWVLLHLLVVFLGVLLIAADFLQVYLSTGIREAVGASLVASGVTGIVLFLHVRLSDTLQSRLEIIYSSGLKNIFEARSVRIKYQYDERLKDFKSLDLVGLGLGSFREDYADKFAAWSQKAKIRILLPDPTFPSPKFALVDLRDQEEGREKGETKKDVELFVKAVRNSPGLNLVNFSVRYYRAIPAINVLRIDDEIFWGPYLMEEQSRNSPTLIVSRGGFLFGQLHDHFEALWKAAREIP